jgi:hypothetical protein
MLLMEILQLFGIANFKHHHIPNSRIQEIILEEVRHIFTQQLYLVNQYQVNGFK